MQEIDEDEVGETSRARPRPRRTRVLVLSAVGVLAVAMGITAVTLSGLPVPGVPGLPGGPASDGDPATAAEPVEPAPVTEPGALDDDEAAAIVQHVLATPFEPVETAEELDARMQSVAVDHYLEELEAEWLELVTSGWSFSGKPEVVSAEVTDLGSSKQGATAEVVACIDSSQVRMLDAEGDPIGDSAAPRARQLFTLTQGDDTGWRIAARSFPDNPEC